MAQATKYRPSRPTERSGARRRKRGTAEGVVTLARWQFGQTWRLLLLAEVGILAAVALICLLPLYSSVALSTALRDSLASSPANAYVVESGDSSLYTRQKVQQFGQRVEQKIQGTLQNYIQAQPVFSASLQPLAIAKSMISETDLGFTGFAEQQIPQHVKLISGHLPQTASNVLEFVTTPSGLQTLEQTNSSYGVGHVFQYPITLVEPYGLGYQTGSTFTLPMEDVGVVALSSLHDTFWHGMDFQVGAGNKTNAHSKGSTPVTTIPALISNEALGVSLEGIEAEISGATLYEPVSVSWYYPLRLTSFDVAHLGEITTHMSHLLTNLSLGGDPLSDTPSIQNTTTIGPMSIFQYYSDRVTLLDVSVGVLILLIGGLILFAIGVIVVLLLEEQEEALSLMRSRGATRGQLVAALSAQGALLALPVLLLGPVVAYALTVWLAQRTLQGADRSALNVLTTQPLAAMLSVGWIALVVVCVSLLIMAVATAQKLRATFVLKRREAARNSRPPLWQRWRLDLVGVVIALVGAGFALYLANSGVLNARTRALILPLVLLGACLGLLIAGVLVLFRFFPKILRGMAQLTLHSRGATTVLALAQMARGYQQALRMALLFAFTLAFAVFPLSFNASQLQRLTDGVGFQVGSDFSGILPGPASVADWQTQEQGYAQFPGIQAATIGYAGIMQGTGTQPIDVLAVDAGTCAQTMYWSAPDSPQSVAPLLQKLVAQRQASIQANLIPVLVDASAAQSLDLTTGTRFSLKDQYGAVTFITLGIVQYIPSVLDDSVNAGTSDATVTGGILADYATFAGVQDNVNGLSDVAESIWLKSSSNPAALARVRNELNNGQLQVSSLSDRRVIAASLAYDPLEDAMESWLWTGAAVALVLGLFGTLLGSWSSARKRILNFALMRALGNTPGQIVRIVLWEQGLIYALALCIGPGGGLLCAWLLLPGLLYTPAISVSTVQALTQGAGLNLTGTGELYLAQGVPAAHVVMPWLPILALCGVVLLICVLALSIIVRLVTRQALSESLRMNED